MRNALVATAVALTLWTGPLRAANRKEPPADVGPGRAAWFDISASNLAQAREFYGRLFDWRFNPVPGIDLAAEIVAGGTAIGTLRVAEGKLSPFNGVVCIQVTGVQAGCRKAKELGGPSSPGFPST